MLSYLVRHGLLAPAADTDAHDRWSSRETPGACAVDSESYVASPRFVLDCSFDAEYLAVRRMPVEDCHAETSMHAQVGIVGAGPAGLMLSHLLQRAGISVLKAESRAYVCPSWRSSLRTRRRHRPWRRTTWVYLMRDSRDA